MHFNLKITWKLFMIFRYFIIRIHHARLYNVRITLFPLSQIFQERRIKGKPSNIFIFHIILLLKWHHHITGKKHATNSELDLNFWLVCGFRIGFLIGHCLIHFFVILWDVSDFHFQRTGVPTSKSRNPCHYNFINLYS